MITLEITSGFGVIQCTYNGGPYIHLMFGEGSQPIEVINVFDYEKSEPKISNTPEAVEAAFKEWLDSQSDYNLEQYFQRQAQS